MNSATLKHTAVKPPDISFYIYKYYMVQIRKETGNIWEYKVGNNAIIVNFVRL